MKLDDIIKELRHMECPNNGIGVHVNILIGLVKELAHHVKAQEPEPLTEEELQLTRALGPAYSPPDVRLHPEDKEYQHGS